MGGGGSIVVVVVAWLREITYILFETDQIMRQYHK